MIDFSGVSLPFSIGDLISSGSDLLMFVGSFLLVSLAFIVVQSLVGLIRHANYVHQATKGGYTHEARQKARKQLWSGNEIKHSIRMHFKGKWE